MATTVHVHTMTDRYVLVREWDDLTHVDRTAFAEAASTAADNKLLKNEKTYVHQMLRIALSPRDFAPFRSEAAFGALTTQEAGRILGAVVDPGSEVFDYLTQIQCIAVLTDDPAEDA